MASWLTVVGLFAVVAVISAAFYAINKRRQQEAWLPISISKEDMQKLGLNPELLTEMTSVAVSPRYLLSQNTTSRRAPRSTDATTNNIQSVGAYTTATITGALRAAIRSTLPRLSASQSRLSSCTSSVESTPRRGDAALAQNNFLQNKNADAHTSLPAPEQPRPRSRISLDIHATGSLRGCDSSDSSSHLLPKLPSNAQVRPSIDASTEDQQATPVKGKNGMEAWETELIDRYSHLENITPAHKAIIEKFQASAMLKIKGALPSQ